MAPMTSRSRRLYWGTCPTRVESSTCSRSAVLRCGSSGGDAVDVEHVRFIAVNAVGSDVLAADLRTVLDGVHQRHGMAGTESKSSFNHSTMVPALRGLVVPAGDRHLHELARRTTGLRLDDVEVCLKKDTSSPNAAWASDDAMPERSGLDVVVIQPYGCINDTRR